MLTQGDLAPDFTLTDQHRQQVTLSQLRGQVVVVLFYPMSFTPVCGSELVKVRDDLPDLTEKGVEVLAVSVDSAAAHRAWDEAEGFGFRLLADFWPHGGVAQQYDVLDEQRGLARRGTFVLDREGRVVWSTVNDVPDARDHDELLAAVDQALAA